MLPLEGQVGATCGWVLRIPQEPGKVRETSSKRRLGEGEKWAERKCEREKLTGFGD